jgi:hypothetical protein
MKGWTRGLQDHGMLILSLCLLSIFAPAMPALCVSIDTSGTATWCEIKGTAVTKATVQDPNPEHVIYGLEGQYTYVASDSSMACPSGVKSTSGKGEWLKAAPGFRGTAIENFGPVRTMSKCTQNPWVNQSTDCIVLDIKVPQGLKYSGPVPISANAMNGAQKQTLLQLQMAKVIAQNLTTGPLIQVLSPQGGQEFMGDVTVQVKFRSDVQAKVNKLSLKWFWFKSTPPQQMVDMSYILPEIAVINGEAKALIPWA